METLGILSKWRHRDDDRQVSPATTTAFRGSIDRLASKATDALARFPRPGPERSAGGAMLLRGVLAIVPIATAAVLCWMFLSWPWIAGGAAFLGLAVYAYVSR